AGSKSSAPGWSRSGPPWVGGWSGYAAPSTKSRNVNEPWRVWKGRSPGRRNDPMPVAEGKQSVTVVTACMTRDGLPDLVLTEVAVTPEEFDNGVHFYLVEARLAEGGYEEPYVHFADREAPAFLIPAVRQYLAASPDVIPFTPVPSSKEPRCP